MPILPYLRLLRAGTLFSPAADVVAGLCLCGLAWSATAVHAVVASVLLYAAGMVLNDCADRDEDRRQRPERPLPRGEIPVTVAFAFGLLLLGGGVWLAPDWRWHGGMAVLILAYDFGAKRVLALGAALLGTLRALNLASAAVLLPALTPELRTPLLAAAAAYFVYIFAVTLVGHLEDGPEVRPRAAQALLLAPPLAGAAALLCVQGTLWPAPLLWLLAAGWFGRRNRRIAIWDRGALRQAMTWLLLGILIYDASLCLACARHAEAVACALAVLPARWISRRIALT